MEKKLVFGAIGLMFGNAHLEGALAYGAEVAAICDLDAETLRKSGEKYNIPEEKWTTDYHDILNNPEINMVSIAIPDQDHRKVACEMLAAGKHVLCEKAITLNSDELNKAVALASEKNLILAEAMTIYNMPLYTELEKIIKSGKLGEFRLAQVNFGSFKEYDMTNRFFNMAKIFFRPHNPQP